MHFTEFNGYSNLFNKCLFKFLHIFFKNWVVFFFIINLHEVLKMYSGYSLFFFFPPLWEACRISDPRSGMEPRPQHGRTSPVALVVKNSLANAGDIRDAVSIPDPGRSSGEGNGNLLQHSYLEDPTDRGAWRVTVHGVSKSWTWLSTWQKKCLILTTMQPGYSLDIIFYRSMYWKYFPSVWFGCSFS